MKTPLIDQDQFLAIGAAIAERLTDAAGQTVDYVLLVLPRESKDGTGKVDVLASTSLDDETLNRVLEHVLNQERKQFTP
jgi:hypothetical protein